MKSSFGDPPYVLVTSVTCLRNSAARPEEPLDREAIPLFGNCTHQSMNVIPAEPIDA
jgi:hypothetical protein